MFHALCAIALCAATGFLVLANDGKDEKPAPIVPTYKYPVGDIKACLMNPLFQKTNRYEVLPGMGWDNLENKDAALLVVYNYSQCKTTDDGRYLLPDSVVTVPIKSSQLETYAEIFEHWSNYTSTTSSSINFGAGLQLTHFGISGKFSHESEHVKMQQVRDRSVTTRVQARYVRYTAKLQPDTPLSPTFKNRLSSIATNIQLNKTSMATYESQLLVRDFGTHVVTSIDAGAIIGQLDEIKSTFTRNRDFSKSEILASASASFFSVAKISSEYHHVTTKEQIDQYLGNRSHSKILSYGGPVYKPTNFSLDQWAEEIGNELIAVDRAGDPIYYLISPHTLPELSPSILYDLTENVKAAVEEYYKFNVYKGCTKPDSPNFSFIANVDDGSCESPFSNYTFGGVYQTCSQNGYLNQNLCSALVQKNPLTGDFSCPEDYEAILVNRGSRTARESRRSCHRSWFSRRCRNYFVWGTATYTSYWCVARGSVHQQSGFQFGGLYTDTVPNLLTGSKSCPLFYYPLKMGKSMKICVSDDFELGFQYSVPFAGFYSCLTGNPLMIEKESTQSHDPKMTHIVHSLGSYLQSAAPSHWPKGCPNGYSSHLATVEHGCEINYCVKAHAFSGHGLPQLRRPPFVDLPSDAYIDMGTVYNFEISQDDNTWTEISDSKTDTGTATAQSGGKGTDDGQNESGLTTGVVVAISVCVAIGLLLVLMFMLRRRKKLNLYRRMDRMCGDTNLARHDAYGTAGETSVPMNTD